MNVKEVYVSSSSEMCKVHSQAVVGEPLPGRLNNRIPSHINHLLKLQQAFSVRLHTESVRFLPRRCTVYQ